MKHKIKGKISPFFFDDCWYQKLRSFLVPGFYLSLIWLLHHAANREWFAWEKATMLGSISEQTSLQQEEITTQLIVVYLKNNEILKEFT